MADDEVDDGAYFGFRRWVGSGAELLELLPPAGRKIAIQVKALFWLLDTQHKAVVVLESAFGDQSIIGSARLRRLAADQEPGLIGMRLP